MVPFVLPEGDLDAAVRVLVGSATARVLTREHSAVAWRIVSDVTGGLHRLSGTYEDGDHNGPWSLVLKINRRPLSSTDESWRREELAYTSGILRPSRGFATARCLAVTRPSSTETWLWLEDIEDEGGELLSVERHALAARHLGVFNGSHLVGTDAPPGWLVTGWLPELLPLIDADEASVLVRRPGTWRHPAVRAAFPSPTLDDLERLTRGASDVFVALAALPESLCHLDPGRFNICTRRDTDGRDETVLLDWQLLGVGPLGTDLAMMNALNLYRLYVAPDEAERYSEATSRAYLEGLHEVGVETDDEAVRDAYRAAAALRGGAIVRTIVGQLATDAEGQTAVPGWGRRWGWDETETWRAWGENMRYLMTLA